MSQKIDGVELRPVRVSAGSPVRRSADGTADRSSGGGESAGGDVQITSAARHLASLEQAILDLPAVDPARVEKVQQRLASGRYEVDPQRVADGLARMDRELARLLGGK